MQLLYVTGQYPKTSESFVRNEVRAQRDAGHGVRVISLRRPEAFERCDGEDFVTVPRVPLARFEVPRLAELAVPEDRPTRKAYAIAAARWVIRHGLDDFDPDLVHAHFANLPALVAGHIATLLGVPYTFMAHATDYRRRMSDRLLARRIGHANATFVVSYAARREIADRAGLSEADATRLTVVRAAMRAQVAPLPVRERNAAGPHLVTVARHVPMKGVDLALRAFAKLLGTQPRARYDVVGTGPESGSLHGLADALGIDGAVTFHGRLDNASAQEIIAAADIAVLPCRRDEHGAADGLPVFLMEAGALGLPVVTTPVSGIPELVHDGVGGILVPCEDIDALEVALRLLAGDVGRRRRMGARLRARVEEEFTAERQIERLHGRWDELVDRASPGITAAGPRGRHEPVSVVVVARDEAEAIERCVRSASWADEVVVAVDDRTTDETAKLARAAGARTEPIRWRGFSGTKNDAAGLATHDWVVSLDADEAASRMLRQQIEQTLCSGPDPRDGFAFVRRSDFLGVLLPNDTRAATRRNAVRLYNRRHSRWDETTAVHETVRTTGTTHLLAGVLIQWRAFDLDELFSRFNRYATMEAAQMRSSGRRPTCVDVTLRPVLRFAWHYLARGEFRLGAHGLVHSGVKAASEFMRWAKLWEHHHGAAHGEQADLDRVLARH